MRKFILLIPLFFVFGCATHVVSSSARSVVVESQSLNAGEAQTQADQECARHKKFAQMTSKGSYWERNYTFACVD